MFHMIWLPRHGAHKRSFKNTSKGHSCFLVVLSGEQKQNQGRELVDRKLVLKTKKTDLASKLKKIK